MIKPPVEMFQSEFEFTRLLRLYKALGARRVLEIGSLFGGTLWQWMTHARPGAEFVSVDMLVPEYDDRRAAQEKGHKEQWPAWAEEMGHSLRVIEGSSQNEGVIRSVRKSAPFDFAFIDGDHSYAAAKSDFVVYSEMVRPGGLVALHDIDISEQWPQWYGVQPLWQEIKQNHRTREFIEERGWWGIGVVFL